jgi:hypothetical protein
MYLGLEYYIVFVIVVQLIPNVIVWVVQEYLSWTLALQGQESTRIKIFFLDGNLIKSIMRKSSN